MIIVGPFQRKYSILLMNFTRFLSLNSSNLSRSLWVVTPPSSISVAPLPNMPLFLILLRICSVSFHQITNDHWTYWSQYGLLRHAFHNWPSHRFLTIDNYSSSLTVQPVSHWPFLLEGIQSIALRFGYKDAMRDCIRRLAEVNVNSIHCPVHSTEPVISS